MIPYAPAPLATRAILSTAKPSLLRKTSAFTGPKSLQDGPARVSLSDALIVNVGIVLDRDEDAGLIN
jgi:hypothetical protein